MEKSKIGLIGLGVMGQSLARNIANKGFKISVYNRTASVTNEFISRYGSDNLSGSESFEEFIEQLEVPRKIIIMVNAGQAVDSVIEGLKPALDKGDIIIDCGNSNFHNTIRRFEDLQKEGIHFVGCGVSGGEEGALNGPSMMPGGTKEAWEMIREVFEAIAARDFNNSPCVTYVGDNAAGHYVKMVHNGIEYGVMQIMAEAYDLLRKLYKLDAPQISKIFEKYNEGKLKSYLFEIAVGVLSTKDNLSEGYLIDHILDKAAQKGTGKWTAIDALERGMALPTITEAVFARNLSTDTARKGTKYPRVLSTLSQNELVSALENALYAAMLIIYAQGFALIQQAAKENNWDINLAEIARIWEGGCIIRADILNILHEAFAMETTNPHLFEIEKLSEDLKKTIPDLRKVAAEGIMNGVPVAGLSTALSYFDSITNKTLPANFIQGLRDYFGAHTYERIDKEGSFHTEWMQ